MRSVSLLIVFIAGLLSGMLLLYKVPSLAPQAEDMGSMEHAAKHLVPGYVCPMHPSVVSNAPGNCPICGMALEPKSLDAANNGSDAVAVSPAISHSLGVRIAHAEIGRVSEQVFATGNVEVVTAAQTTEVMARVEGKIARVLVEKGAWVSEGDILLEIDSSIFAETQAAYLEALDNRDYKLIAELRNQLTMMHVREVVLRGIDRESGKPLPPEYLLEAPYSGIIEWIESPDTTIKLEQQLVRIVAPTIARARLRSYARAARSIKPGRHAQLGLPHMPGLYWPGQVVEVDHADAGFYSMIQAEFEVPDDSTEKGVFVGAYLNAGTSADVLRIPASAVIRAEGQSRVVRLRADGQFEPVRIETGYVGREWAEIRSGLSEGDAVVEGAQFLIDSEATLRAGMARLVAE